jgi:tRNA pseudouridine55 synthase
VCVLKRAQDAQNQVQGGLQRQHVGPAGDTAQQLRSAGTLNELHHHIQLRIVLTEVEHLHNVRVTQLSRDTRFVDEHGNEVFVLHELRNDALQCKRLFEPVRSGAAGKVHFRHTAGREVLHELIRSENLSALCHRHSEILPRFPMDVLRANERAMHGVVVIDKPIGPTSHDVVAQLRRALKTRRVGHAGTLDPLASGVLVLAVGEATKLVPYLTSGDKTYEATVRFGVATPSLDSGSPIESTQALGRELSSELEQLALLGRTLDSAPLLQAAIETERARLNQIPPNVSAIHVDGERAHARARRGETFELPAREVRVRELTVLGASADTLRVRLCVSKGYYVRAFARDVAKALGTVGIITALRRTHSGNFDLSLASSIERPTLMPLPVAANLCLPAATLTEVGLQRAKHGKTLDFEHMHPHHEGEQAWFDAAGTLVALATVEAGVGRVQRGITSTSSES